MTTIGDEARPRITGGDAATALSSARAPRFLVAAGLLLVLYAAVRAAVVISQGPIALVNAYEDDAYYYFGIARSMAEGAGSTFNHLTPTNGYHPLWQLVLAAVATAGPADVPLLAYLVIAILFVATGLLFLRVSVRLGQPALGALALLLVLCVPYGSGRWLFSGMENALLLPLLLGYLLLALWPTGDGDGGRNGRLVGAGVVGALMVLTRLDSTVLILMAAAVVAWSCRKDVRAATTRLILLAGPAAVALACYLMVNRAVFGTWLPVSGQAKAIGGGGDWGGQVGRFLMFGARAGIGMGLLFLLTTPLAILLAARYRLFCSAANRFVLRTLVVLAAAQILQFCYFTTTSTWRWWPWYYYLVGVQLFFAAIVVLRLLAKLTPRAHTVVVLVTVVAAVGFVGLSLREQAGLGRKVGVHSDGLVVAQWINEHVEPNTIMAMGDRAGVVGWSVPNPVIQIEGLTESASYLDVLRTGTVAENLQRRGTAIYVRWDREPTASRGCWAFLEPTAGGGPRSAIRVCADQLLHSHRSTDGSTWTVWHLR